MGKAPTGRKASSPADFKKGPEPVELPSGHYMVIRKAGLQALMAAGQIPNELLGIIQSAIDKGQSADEVNKKFVVDEDRMNQMFTLMENTVCFCAQDPPVHPRPKGDEERDPELLYVDELNEEDRVFIFQYVTGGTKDLATFRTELSGIMATVPGREDMALPAK